MQAHKLQAHRLNVKLYLDSQVEIDQEGLIPVFHRWIQNRDVADELLIDVADYKHVPDGPGVMLIAHQAHFGLDSADGRLGLLYARKRPDALSFEERLRSSAESVLRVGLLLERDVPGVTLAGDRWAFRVFDRLRAPNTPETYQAFEPLLEDVLGDLYPGAGVQLRWEDDPQECFGVQVTAAERPGLATLLERWERASLPVAAVA